MTLPGYLDPGIFPVRSFHIQLDGRQFGQLERQLQKFGVAFGFDNKSRLSTPAPYDMLFYMTRNEVDLIGGNVTQKGAASLTFSIGLFPKRDRPPPPPENVNVLVAGLKKYLEPIQGSIVTEIKSP